uniref:Uncharacterized protein n=1 Tax=Oryza meridionalis TaxID=40149 RepID=A0A0E0DQE2_9ORYZ
MQESIVIARSVEPVQRQRLVHFVCVPGASPSSGCVSCCKTELCDLDRRCSLCYANYLYFEFSFIVCKHVKPTTSKMQMLYPLVSRCLWILGAVSWFGAYCTKRAYTPNQYIPICHKLRDGFAATKEDNLIKFLAHLMWTPGVCAQHIQVTLKAQVVAF